VHKELKARLLQWYADYHAAKAAEAREKVVTAYKILFDLLVECRIDPPGPGTAEWWSTAYGIGNDDDFGEKVEKQLTAYCERPAGHGDSDDDEHDMEHAGGGTTLANGRHTMALENGQPAIEAAKPKQLVVANMSASGLAKADGMFGKSDPYCSMLSVVLALTMLSLYR
jgi:hypothetical protein